MRCLADRYPPLPHGGAVALALRLFLLNIRGRLEYRLDFLMGVLHGIAYQLVGVAFIWAVLTRFPSLGGWSLGEVAFLYALRLLIHSLYLPFLWNVMTLSSQVRQGELDRLLLRPVHPLLLVITRTFQINAVGDLLTALVLFWGAQSAVGIEWTLAKVGYLVLVLAGGVLLETGVQLAISSLSIWLVHAERINWWADTAFNSFGNYPLTVYGGAVRFAFVFILPLAFVSYFPATVILEREAELAALSLSPALAYGAPAAGVVVFALALGFFRFALTRYRSTGN